MQFDKDKFKNVVTTITEDSGATFWLATFLPFLLPFFLIGAFIWFMMRQAQRGMIGREQRLGWVQSGGAGLHDRD